MDKVFGLHGCVLLLVRSCRLLTLIPQEAQRPFALATIHNLIQPHKCTTANKKDV